MSGIDWKSHVEDLVMIWAVVNPFGTVPVFIAVTRDMAPQKRPKIAIRAVSVATIVLLFMIATGQLLLEALDIP